jgi:hypothetical protein
MQQSEVHEHTIETTVFKWQILCLASPELNLRNILFAIAFSEKSIPVGSAPNCFVAAEA